MAKGAKLKAWQGCIFTPYGEHGLRSVSYPSPIERSWNWLLSFTVEAYKHHGSSTVSSMQPLATGINSICPNWLSDWFQMGNYRQWITVQIAIRLSRECMSYINTQSKKQCLFQLCMLFHNSGNATWKFGRWNSLTDIFLIISHYKLTLRSDNFQIDLKTIYCSLLGDKNIDGKCPPSDNLQH